MKADLLNLEDRIDRLSKFIYSRAYDNIVSDEDRILLNAQYHAMVLYHTILQQRCNIHEV